ncbi:MAG: Lrp/AsnC ligand binding domain-containing protein [Candidatus Bathyarchaeota archaeon]
MDRAIIMLTLEPDVGRAPLEEVKKIAGVIETHMLYGPYDGYALIEAKNSGQIQDIVIKKIRSIEGIKSTMTCFVAE